ncbi:MAG TPA: TetR/AcrR family transcriptional regulator [Beijerinckiaceae bacterium]|nr:TetR/AcrR family transcriptional regulator [Beijerinckiaceae bacterium]
MPKSAVATGARRGELKERLTDAASRLIEAKGLASVKARPLAEKAGCALGAIYTVFPDLDALILAVSARTLARLEAHLDAIAVEVAAEATPREAARQRLVALALAYLDFAFAHRASWRALFEHRLPEGRPVPEWMVAEQARLFGKVEVLLGPLVPHMGVAQRAMLARSLFSAVHGLVLLGLEEKLGVMPFAMLREEVERLVSAMARGLEEMDR